MNQLFAYIKNPTFRKQLLIVFIAFVLILIAMNIFLRYYTKHGEGQKVPNFKRQTLENAISIIEEQGLRYQIDSVYVLDKPPGVVVEQDPDPFTLVKPNRIIYLTVTTRRIPKVMMPDIENVDIREALAIIENYGLKLGDTIYRSDIARDVVLEVRTGDKIVEQGTNIPKGTVLDLVLGDGLGANTVAVPNLLGLTVKQAVALIKRASLTPGRITYSGIKDSLKATVSIQKPEPTDSVTKVSIGSRIDLILSDK